MALAAPRIEPVLQNRQKAASAKSASELLQTQEAAGIVRLTLNRPAEFNALTHSMVRSLLAALEELSENDMARVIILEGAGPNFSSGADHAALGTGKTNDQSEVFYRSLAHMMVFMAQMRQPIIARVEGLATSEGCQLVAGCDLAVAGRSAKFALPDLDAGIACTIPMVAVSRAIGPKRTLDMVLASNMMTGEEAYAAGLVSRLAFDYELDHVCLNLARRIASLPQPDVAAAKKTLAASDELPLAKAYAQAFQLMGKGKKAVATPTAPKPIQAQRLRD